MARRPATDRILDGHELIDSFFSNNSDRALAIVAGSVIELWLESYLEMMFKKCRYRRGNNKVDLPGNLFKPDEVLGSFRAKIDIAFVSGLIGKRTHRDLTIIKDIRNLFAHDPKAIAFDKPPITDLCKNLQMPFSWQSFNQDFGDNPTPRQYFYGAAFAFMHLVHYETNRIREMGGLSKVFSFVPEHLV